MQFLDGSRIVVFSFCENYVYSHVWSEMNNLGIVYLSQHYCDAYGIIVDLSSCFVNGIPVVLKSVGYYTWIEASFRSLYLPHYF